MSSEYAFQVTGLNKRFGPTHANKDIDFTLKKGEVRGLAGENGSGKSTLLSQLAGIYSSDSGTILKDGETYAPDSPLYAQQHGVSIVVQELHLAGFHADGIELGAGVERVVDNATRADVAQLRTDERAALAGLHVLELDDGPQLVVVFDAHAVLEVCSGNSHWMPPLLIYRY